MLRFLTAVLFFSASPAWADMLTGYIVSITDGDTLTLLVEHQQHKIRISGIDAPERVQSFGDKSTANLARYAFNKNATAECGKKDRYGRDICVVYVDRQDVGLAQIRDGLAWWYWKYAKEQSPENRANYEQAETVAKLSRLGLWVDSQAVPPWEWRHIRRR